MWEEFGVQCLVQQHFNRWTRGGGDRTSVAKSLNLLIHRRYCFFMYFQRKKYSKLINTIKEVNLFEKRGSSTKSQKQLWVLKTLKKSANEVEIS